MRDSSIESPRRDAVVSASRSAPIRWQFSLRRLLLAIGGAAALLAVFRLGDLPNSSAFVWSALLAAAIVLPSATRRPFIVVLAAMYLPYVWSLWEDFPILGHYFTDTQWQRIVLWPVLPGLLPGAILFHPHDAPEFACMALCTLVFAGAATAIAARGRRWLMATVLVVLGLSAVSAFFARVLLHAG